MVVFHGLVFAVLPGAGNTFISPEGQPSVMLPPKKIQPSPETPYRMIVRELLFDQLDEVDSAERPPLARDFGPDEMVTRAWSYQTDQRAAIGLYLIKSEVQATAPYRWYIEVSDRDGNVLYHGFEMLPVTADSTATEQDAIDRLLSRLQSDQDPFVWSKPPATEQTTA